MVSTMEGTLSKWTNVVQGWQTRYFSLNDDVLLYYTSREKMSKYQQRGCIRLQGAAIGIDGENSVLFTITVDGKTFHMQGRNQDERDVWVRALEKVIREKSGYYRLRPEDPIAELSMKAAFAQQHLQQLLEQTKRLEKIDRDSTRAEHKRKKRLDDVLHTTKNLQNVVQHSIVILKQIEQNFGLHHKTSSNNREQELPPNLKEGLSVQEDSDSENPPLSYSSSDNEYADANSNFGSSSLANEMTPSASTTITQLIVVEKPISPTPTVSRPSIASLDRQSSYGDENENFDKIYDCPDRTELGDIQQQHGSVLGHLLSQLSIGMDLTKVSLPTFILERRSLLEMYAEFFAHPDDFTSGTSVTNPEDRFLNVVRYYLNSFYPARKGDIAKKPYNPILGETFRCRWAIPGSTMSGQKTTAGPFPGSDINQVTFLAEQVSHHPPISAFYAEHPATGVSCNADIYTKSQFYGLSIGVHNIGQGIIELHKYNEKYTVTFPSGYGRSIMSVPWIELGGKVDIRCEKTGYFAEIEFLTKLLVIRGPHKIAGSIYRTGEKKPFITLQGEWNGQIFMKRAGENKETLFNDAKLKPDVRKECVPVADQEDRESRRLWRHVTAALFRSRIDVAGKSKHFIEQRQRREAKERLEMGIVYTPKNFIKIDGRWVYRDKLENRISSSII